MPTRGKVMRKAAKRTLRPAAPKKRWGYKANPALVRVRFAVLPDGAHAVWMPIHTKPFSNGSQGWSRKAGFAIAREKKRQRKAAAEFLFGIGISFRSIHMVRLAPSSGLDTGNLWNALKAVQDGIADHLGIDDGPKSPASWTVG